MRTKPRYWLGWLTVSRVASASVIVVALLLFLPIRIFAAGDHEKRSCGNAVSMDITAWRGGDAGDQYFETAFKACTTKRVNRLAEAVAVISVTILALTLISARRRNAGALPTAAKTS